MCLRWRNLNELMREEYYHQQFGERRTRNGTNDGTENTERADLVDNQIIGHYNQDIDNNNQNIDNNNQNVNNNNQDIDHDNQDVSNDNQDVDDNNQHDDDNQDVDDNKQNVDYEKQDLDDKFIANNQIVIKIAEESNKIPSFWFEECSSNNEDDDIRQRSSSYYKDTFEVVAEVHVPYATETLV